jgi:hypothetical protein
VVQLRSSFARRAAPIGLWGGVLLAPASAYAQDQPPPLLPEEKPQIIEHNTAVTERVQPGYVAPGFDLGSFTLSPSLKVSGLYDDNILGLAQNGESDAILRIQPDVSIQSNWARNSLSFDASGTIDRYATHSSENIADYDLSSAGVLQITQDLVARAGIRVESDHQSRLSQDIFAETINPIAYTKQSGAISLTQDLGRLRVSTDATVSHSNYQNGQMLDGSVYEADTSDNVSYQVGTRVSYAQSSSLAWFVRALYNNRNFSVGTPTVPARSSQGYQVLAGVDFEPAALLRGSIGIGYIQQLYNSPFYTSFAGFGFNGKVQFFPTQLTTVTVSGDRSVQDSGIPGSGGYLSTNGSIRVDHELLRQLLLGAQVGYQYNVFHNLDRRDGRVAVGANSTYRMNRNVSLELNYNRLVQTSHGADRFRAFTDNRLMFGVTLRR